MSSAFDVWQPRILSILRIVAGLLFLQHGLVKLFAFPMAFPYPVAHFSLSWFAAVIEVIGGRHPRGRENEAGQQQQASTTRANAHGTLLTGRRPAIATSRGLRQRSHGRTHQHRRDRHEHERDQAHRYDVRLVNDKLDRAVDELAALLRQYRDTGRT